MSVGEPRGSSHLCSSSRESDIVAIRFCSRKRNHMRKRLLQTTLAVLSTFFSVGTVSVAANTQTSIVLPTDVIAANRELDHELLEGQRLLDAENVMSLFTSSPDVLFHCSGWRTLQRPRPSAAAD